MSHEPLTDREIADLNKLKLFNIANDILRSFGIEERFINVDIAVSYSEDSALPVETRKKFRKVLRDILAAARLCGVLRLKFCDGNYHIVTPDLSFTISSDTNTRVEINSENTVDEWVKIACLLTK